VWYIDSRVWPFIPSTKTRSASRRRRQAAGRYVVVFMYKIVIEDKVEKFLRSIPEDDFERFLEKIKIIAQNPHASLPFVARLKGSSYFRFRFGDYRCVYSVVNHILTIVVIDAGHRKNIYRR
jgi:mRNA interferase RelE/StbE